MKKIFLSLLFCGIIGYIGYSQSLALSDSAGAIPNNSNITVSGLPTADEIVSYIFVKNISASSVSVKVKKVELSLVDGSGNTFCWGLCFSTTVYVSPDPKSIEKDSINKIDFSGHYYPTTKKGVSVIRYVFFVTDNPADSVCVNVTYSAFPLGIGNIQEKPSLSNAYPNPAGNHVNFDNSLQPGNEGQLIIRNLLGSVIKESVLQGTSEKLTINTTDLADGIYFYSFLVNGQNRFTRKLVIRH